MKKAQANRYNHALDRAGIGSRPIALLDLGAFEANADSLVQRAGAAPIRVASKSLRVRSALHHVLQRPGFRGVLCFTLDEALWLASHGFTDLVVAYPQADAQSISRWASSAQNRREITLMIDDRAQLDLIDRIAGRHQDLKVALELDVAYYPRPNLRIGAARSPLRGTQQVVELARHVLKRKGFILDGLMGYEAQIASVPDRGIGPKAWLARAIRVRSTPELEELRAQTVAAVSDLTSLRFVNAGGTGSLETSARELAVSEVSAGSGLFAPGLFDSFRAFRPAPALFTGFHVVRRPDEHTVTILGGGWVASGPAGRDRLPRIEWPRHLSYRKLEGAGEVQTPLQGRSAHKLRIGDTVWLRHAKAGEAAERVNQVAVYSHGRILDQWPTYRGEGKAFL